VKSTSNAFPQFRKTTHINQSIEQSVSQSIKSNFHSTKYVASKSEMHGGGDKSECSLHAVSCPGLIYRARQNRLLNWSTLAHQINPSCRDNSLPRSFRDATPTLGQFQRRLKTSLFRLAYGCD